MFPTRNGLYHKARDVFIPMEHTIKLGISLYPWIIQFLSPTGRFCFWLVGMSVCPSGYLKSNKRICMNVLPVVCLGSRNNPLNSGMIGLPSTHWAHDVAAMLNQRHWRWFNVAITSCAKWSDPGSDTIQIRSGSAGLPCKFYQRCVSGQHGQGTIH